MCSRPTFCARSEFDDDGFPYHLDSAPSTCFVRSSNRTTMDRSPTQSDAADQLETVYKADFLCSRPTFYSRSEFEGDRFLYLVGYAPSTCFVETNGLHNMLDYNTV